MTFFVPSSMITFDRTCSLHLGFHHRLEHSTFSSSNEWLGRSPLKSKSQLSKILTTFLELSLNYCTFELVLENLPQTAGFWFFSLVFLVRTPAFFFIWVTFTKLLLRSPFAVLSFLGCRCSFRSGLIDSLPHVFFLPGPFCS